MSAYVDPLKVKEIEKLQAEAKQLASEGDLEESLKRLELAKEIFPTPKVLKRIEKLKECLSSISSICSRSSQSNEVNSEHLNSFKHADVTKCEDDVKRCSNTNVDESRILIDIKNKQHHPKVTALVTEPSDLSPLSKVKFKQLKNKAKTFAYDGNYEKAVESFTAALSVCDCPNVKKYIKELQLLISSNQEEKKKDYSSENNYQNTTVPNQESFENNTVISSNASQISNTNEHLAKNKKSPSGCVQQLSVKEESLSVLSSTSSKVSDTNEDFIENKKSSSQYVQQSHSQGSLSTSDGDKENSFDSERKLSEVKSLYEDARELASDGKLKDALKKLEKAQSIHPTQKVKKRIDKIKDLISSELGDADEKMVQVADGFFVFHEIFEKLYPYQREGVAWMWKLYKMRQGGVLGDDMGLGKTFQAIAFISGMIDADLVKHILIIMPVSLLRNWEREFKKWCPGIAVYDFHSGTKKERERNLLRVQRRGHVLLTSYGMVLNNLTALTEMDDRNFIWDYVILDEGHKIKNPTKTTKAVYEIPARNRLVLTGTPIQNNLRELWSLYDFVHQGTLLGSLRTFKMQYETPITRSREKDATVGEKRLGSQMAENLKTLIKPYFLRRTKEEIWKKEEKDVNELGEQLENMKISTVTAKKNDLILWTCMSEPQIAIYTDFLHSEAVKSILLSKRSPLVELTTLKKICDHPRLLSQRACHHLGLNGDLQKEHLESLDDESALASSIENVTDESLLLESGKLKLVIDLLKNLKENGHRTLVFSLSRKILDMIHRILVNRNWKVMRLDGTITKTEERERRIRKFQSDASYPVFLLTTQVGGVGITLTAADRVIIYDPSWNPATDAQAVDRAYRIGQERDVVVYRLITCGTVEEKIYRRQIFKDSITRQTTGLSDPFRYFSKQELRELFSLENPYYSATQVQLHEMHSSQRKTYDELEKHMCFLRNMNIFGISDHDLMFSKEVEDHSEDNDPSAVSDNFIQQRVNQAQQLIQMEALVAAEGIRSAGTFSRPYQENIPLQKKTGAKDAYKPPVLPNVIDLTEDAVDYAIPSVSQGIVDISSDSISHIEIQEHTPKAKNEDKKQLSPYKSKEVDGPFPQKEQFFTSVKQSLADDTVKPIPSTGEIVKGEPESIKEKDIPVDMDSHFKTEKFRKSSFSALDMQDEVKMIEENEDISLSATCVQDTNESITEPLNPSEEKVMELNPINMTSNFQEKFEANFTHLLDDNISDFSFDEARPVTVSSKRKSCARPSAVYISESDVSTSNSASNSIVSDNLAEEDEEDPSNSASLSFVPDSEPSTPVTFKKMKFHESVNETPSASIPLKSKSSFEEISGRKDTPTSIKVEGTVKRITPLKVDKSVTRENSPFVQAMAKSLILTPESSHGDDVSHNISNASLPSLDSDDDDESPIKFNKKKVKQVLSDSEESDAHCDAEDNEHHYDSPSKERQNNEVISNRSSDDETEYSEGNVVEEDSILDLQDEHRSISEVFSEESVSDGESTDHSDLETTYATCKGKESEAESSYSDESEENSNESDGVFSEDD